MVDNHGYNCGGPEEDDDNNDEQGNGEHEQLTLLVGDVTDDEYDERTHPEADDLVIARGDDLEAIKTDEHSASHISTRFDADRH